MQYSVALALFAVLAARAQPKENHVTNQPLAIHAKCRGSEKCVFEGKDLFIDIEIINQITAPVSFPLAYRQKTGPSIRLIDTRTKAEVHLRTNPADPDMANEFTQIGPGKSVTLEWVIKPSEIQQFAKPTIDLSAEITVACKIEANGMAEDFLGIATLRIVGHGKP
jgi:hypothetical protein